MFNWRLLFTEVLQGTDIVEGTSFLAKIRFGVLHRLRYFHHPVLHRSLSTSFLTSGQLVSLRMSGLREGGRGKDGGCHIVYNLTSEHTQRHFWVLLLIDQPW